MGTLQKVETLIEAYHPDTIILEELAHSRRCDRVKRLLYQIIECAERFGIRVATYSRWAVGGILASKRLTTKYEIAQYVARRIPALRPRLPGPRKPWQSEDYRMSIFEACGLCLIHFHEAEKAAPSGTQ